jgi:hypothetical protein
MGQDYAGEFRAGRERMDTFDGIRSDLVTLWLTGSVELALASPLRSRHETHRRHRSIGAPLR